MQITFKDELGKREVPSNDPDSFIGSLMSEEEIDDFLVDFK